MNTRHPVTILGDPGNLFGLLKNACSDEEKALALAGRLVVEVPETPSDAFIVVSGSRPSEQSTAVIWVNTRMQALCYRGDGGWVCHTGRPPQMLAVKAANTETDHERSNAYWVALTSQEKEAYGVTGELGRFVYPPEDGVKYL
jgi:hypothetical protein